MLRRATAALRSRLAGIREASPAAGVTKRLLGPDLLNQYGAAPPISFQERDAQGSGAVYLPQSMFHIFSQLSRL